MSNSLSRPFWALLWSGLRPPGQCACLALLLYASSVTWHDYYTHIKFRPETPAFVQPENGSLFAGAIGTFANVAVGLCIVGGVLFALIHRYIGQGQSRAHYLTAAALFVVFVLALAEVNLELFMLGSEDQKTSSVGLWLEGRLGTLPLITSAFWALGLAIYSWYQVPFRE